jgi:hypothetical protein
MGVKGAKGKKSEKGGECMWFVTIKRHGGVLQAWLKADII